MKPPNPRLLIPLVLIAGLSFSGWYVGKQRAAARSELSGFFESQPSELASRIGGRVQSIMVREGDAVKAGQPLLEFETRTNQAETAARGAQAEQAAQQLREMRAGPRPQEIEKQEAVVRE